MVAVHLSPVEAVVRPGPAPEEPGVAPVFWRTKGRCVKSKKAFSHGAALCFAVRTGLGTSR